MQVELCEGRARRMQEEDGQDPFKQLSAQVSRIFAGTAPLFFLRCHRRTLTRHHRYIGPFAGFGAPFLEASLRVRPSAHCAHS